MPVIRNVCHECRIYMPHESSVRRCPFNRNHALQEQSVVPDIEMPLYVAVDRNGSVLPTVDYTQPYVDHTPPYVDHTPPYTEQTAPPSGLSGYVRTDVSDPPQRTQPIPEPGPAQRTQRTQVTDFRDILQNGSIQDFTGDDEPLRGGQMQNPPTDGIRTPAPPPQIDTPIGTPRQHIGTPRQPIGTPRQPIGTRSFFGRVTQTGTIQNLNTRYAPSPKPALTALYDFLVYGAAGGSAYQTFTLLTDNGHTNLDVLIWGAHNGRGTPLSENATVRLVGRMQGAQLIPRYVYVNGDTRRTRFRADPPPAHSWITVLLAALAIIAAVYLIASLLGNPDVINLIKTLLSNLIIAALLCLFIGPLRRLASGRLWVVAVLAVILTFFGGQLLNMLLPVAVGIFFFWLILTAIRGH